MLNALRSSSAIAAVALLATACTVHQTETPAITGPSELGTSITVTATPDSLTQDGASQASIAVLARDASGKPLASLPIRLDMYVAGVQQDFGRLSARSLVTLSDGRATAVYTAPAPPPANAPSSAATVSIAATPTGTNHQNASTTVVDIRLMPAGVILPPASTPTAAFTMSPTQALMNVAVIFDASTSSPGSGATQITSYAWSFGDGTAPGSGQSVTHTFTSQQTFNVTLTVTNDRGLSASTTVATAVGALAAPSPKFVFSPGTPQTGQAVVFNAEQSTAAAGHSLTAFSWNFGDGATGSGFVASHAYSVAGVFNVVLTVTDDTGQRASTALTVSVGGGGGGGATTASFLFSPAAPVVGQVVFFNASGSTAQTGHTLTRYAWDFGDGTRVTNTSPQASYTYSTAGTWRVQLTVTEDTGQTATTTNSITVTAGGGTLKADFTASPTNPVSGALVAFNGNLSTPLASITQFDWDFGDGTVINNGGMIINHTYNTANSANFTIRLTVHDATGATATGTNTLLVAAGADPVASFLITPNPIAVGATATFDASSSSAGAGALINYQWNFGDGSAVVTGATQTHSYAARGTYTITLTVTQTNGRTNSTSHTLLVQ